MLRRPVSDPSPMAHGPRSSRRRCPERDCRLDGNFVCRLMFPAGGLI